MDKREILKLIEEKRTKAHYLHIANGLISNNQSLNGLVDLMIEKEHPINFRAAYLLDLVNCKSPNLVDPYKDNLMEKLPQFNSDSVKRHVLKILATSKSVNPNNVVSLFDFCIETILNANEKVAAKVHAMQLMTNICDHFPELKEEAIEVVTSQMDRNSVAFLARAKKVLTQLKKATKR